VYNNPLKYIDPWGYCGFRADGTIDGYDCDASWFDNQDMATRIKWIKQFMIQSKSQGWFNNIQGILQAFEEEGVGAPGSWLSLVDAGILHAIQDGYAWSENEINSSENSGADEWKTFFDALHGYGDFGRNPADDATIESLWSRAEKEGTAYGETVLANGIEPSVSELVFMGIGHLYRGVGTAPNGGAGAGAAVGGSIGLAVGAAVGIPACAGVPLCVAAAATIGAGSGSTMGYASGDFLTDPRSLIGGHGPVYWVARFVLWE
jgi:hypothetical protein